MAGRRYSVDSSEVIAVGSMRCSATNDRNYKTQSISANRVGPEKAAGSNVVRPHTARRNRKVGAGFDATIGWYQGTGLAPRR